MGNNAGVFRFGALIEVTEGSFHLHYNINLLGTMLTVQEAIKRFGADAGNIINLSSIVGSHPVPGALLYASTKGAIEALTKGLALELAPRKIRVNAIQEEVVFIRRGIAYDRLVRASRPARGRG